MDLSSPDVQSGSYAAASSLESGAEGADEFLALAASAGLSEPPAPPASIVTVRKGDTLWSIAGGDMTRIGQIMEANGLTDSWIYPGETLIVPQKARFSAEEKRHYQAIAQAVFDVDNARLADLGIAVPGGPEVDEPRLRPAVEPEIEVLAEAEEAPAVAEPESDGPQEQAAAEEPEAPQAGEPSLYDLTASAEPDGTAASPTVETAEDETASAALPLVEAEETGEAKQAQAEAAQLEAVEEASPFMSFLEDLGDLGKPIAYGVGATFSPALAKTSLGSKAIGATQSMIMPETGGKTPPEWTTRLGGGFFALSPSPMIYDADVTGFWTYPPRTLRPVHPATGKKGPAGGFAVAPVATWNTDTRDFEAGVGASKVFANNNMLFFINARTDMPFSSEREVSVNFGVVFSVNGLAGSGLGKVGKVAGKAPTLPSMIAKGALTVGSEALDASKDYANVWYGPLWRGEATFDDNGNVVSLTVNGKTVNIDEMMAAGEALLGKEAESDSQFPVEGLNPEFYGP